LYLIENFIESLLGLNHKVLHHAREIIRVIAFDAIMDPVIGDDRLSSNHLVENLPCCRERSIRLNVDY
jgi:hypothetical protein